LSSHISINLRNDIFLEALTDSDQNRLEIIMMPKIKRLFSYIRIIQNKICRPKFFNGDYGYDEHDEWQKFVA